MQLSKAMKGVFSVFLAACLATVLFAGGCKQKEAEIDGIGDFKFGKSTLDDWGFACQPPKDGKTFCQNNPLVAAHHMSLGEQNAFAGALFAGTEKTAPLEELELFVERCHPEKLRAWLQTTFGAPTSESGKAAFWSKKLVFIAAKLPPNGPSCVIKMLDAKNQARIDKWMAWK